MPTKKQQEVYITPEEDQTRLKEAEKKVDNYALLSLAVGLTPTPFFDLAALTAVQLKLVSDLADIYEQPFQENIVRSLLSSLTGWGVRGLISRPLASMIKAIPGLGTLAGGMASSAFGYASTYAIGKVFILQFSSGSTIMTWDPEKVRDYYDEQFELGLKNKPENKQP